MPNLETLASLAHGLSAVIWVGGMFFAYLILRPSLSVLDPPAPLRLSEQVLRRFFGWVWAAVILLPGTGYVLVFGLYGGFANTGLHVHIMHGSGWFMISLFLYAYFVPFKRFATAVQAEEWRTAQKHLNGVRRVMAINLTIGLLNVVAGASGRFWN